jgi:heat shock protein HslJ
MVTKIRRLTAGLAALFVTLSPIAAKAQATAQALAGNWRVFEMAGQAIDPSAEATLSFEDGRVAGKSFCNRYFAGFTATASSFSTTQAGSTQMACPPPEMALERVFLDLLGKATGAETANGVLTLKAKDGRTIKARRI